MSGLSDSNLCESKLSNRSKLFLEDLKPDNSWDDTLRVINGFAEEHAQKYLSIDEQKTEQRLGLLQKYAFEDNYLSFNGARFKAQQAPPTKLAKESALLGFKSLSNFIAALVFFTQNRDKDLDLDQLLEYFTTNSNEDKLNSRTIGMEQAKADIIRDIKKSSTKQKFDSKVKAIATSLAADCKSDFESSLYRDFILKIYLNYLNKNFDFNDIINNLFKKLYIQQLVNGGQLKDSFNTFITRKYFEENIKNDAELKNLHEKISPTAISDTASNLEIMPDSKISYNPGDDLVTKLEQRILELVLDQVQEKLTQVFGIKLNSKDLDIAKDADSCLYFSKNPDSIIYNQSLIDCRTKQTDEAKRTLFDNFLALWQVDDKNNKYPVDLLHCVIDKAVSKLQKIDVTSLQDDHADFNNPTTDDPNNEDNLKFFVDFKDYINFAHSIFLYNLATTLVNWQTSSFSSIKIEDEVKKQLLDVLDKPKESIYFTASDSENQPITLANISLEQLNKIILVCNDIKTCSLESHYSCTNNCIDYLLQQNHSGQVIFDQDNLKKEFLDVVKQCAEKDKSDLTAAAKKCLQDHAPVGDNININLVDLVEKNLEKLKPSLTVIKKCGDEKCPQNNQALKILALQAYLKAKKSKTKFLPRLKDESVCSGLSQAITDAELKFYDGLDEFFELSKIDGAIMTIPMVIPAFEKLYANLIKNYPKPSQQLQTKSQKTSNDQQTAIENDVLQPASLEEIAGQAAVRGISVAEPDGIPTLGKLESINTHEVIKVENIAEVAEAEIDALSLPSAIKAGGAVEAGEEVGAIWDFVRI
jgi:hypothetical protein